MLSEEDQALNFTISSNGWALIVAKSVERQKDYMAKLLDPAKQRGELMPDDYLRGYIQALIWLCKYPLERVENALQEEREEAEIVENSRRYDTLAQVGHTAGIDSQRLED